MRNALLRNAMHEAATWGASAFTNIRATLVGVNVPLCNVTALLYRLYERNEADISGTDVLIATN